MFPMYLLAFTDRLPLKGYKNSSALGMTVISVGLSPCHGAQALLGSVANQVATSSLQGTS